MRILSADVSAESDRYPHGLRMKPRSSGGYGWKKVSLATVGGAPFGFDGEEGEVGEVGEDGEAGGVFEKVTFARSITPDTSEVHGL